MEYIKRKMNHENHSKKPIFCPCPLHEIRYSNRVEPKSGNLSNKYQFIKYDESIL